MANLYVPQGDFITTVLNGALTSASTSATIGGGLGLDVNGGILQIDYNSVLGLGVSGGPETISYASYNSTTGALTGLTRGLARTTAVAHSPNAPVQQGTSSLYSLQGNTLGYAFSTSNFTTASSTAVQVTNLTVSINIPAGGRSVKITGYCGQVSNNTGNDVSVMTLWRGTVASGTQLQQWVFQNPSAAISGAATCIAFDTPTAGSVTYNMGLNASGGTASLNVSSVAPSYILVELI